LPIPAAHPDKRPLLLQHANQGNLFPGFAR
jgi:hypothetical protein